MDNNETQNPNYWFVLREPQGNVIFSTNTPVQTPTVEPRFMIDTDDQQYEQEVEVSSNQQESNHAVRTKAKRQRAKDSDKFWDKNKIKLLLTYCLENKDVDKDTVLTEVSNVLRVSPEECFSKYKHLRRTFLRLLKKKKMGRDIKWTHYDICEEVFTDLKALPPSVLEPWEDFKVRRLLSLYIANMHRFRDPMCLQKDIWKEMAAQLGTTSYNVYHKFKNLKRSYSAWLNRRDSTGKASTKWPYHDFFDRIYSSCDPSAKQWDKTKIKVLLDNYAQVAHKFTNPKIPNKDLWKSIAQKVGENPTACDKKFRNLKQTYLKLKQKAGMMGGLTTKWRYYRDFEIIESNSTRHFDVAEQRVVTTPGHDYIHKLLSFYVANVDKFRDPLKKNKSIWKLIGPKIGLTPGECDKKFRNLKQTYVRLAWKKRQSGKGSNWPYFHYFEEIYEEPRAVAISGGRSTAAEESLRREVRRAVHDASTRVHAERNFETLVRVAEESNNIQKERNRILLAMLDRM